MLRGKGLQHQFGHAFGGTHHIGRAYRLVGANQHEAADTCIYRSLRHVQGTKHIVADTLARVVFDHRHVLIGCCVVDRDRAVFRKNGLQALRVGDAGQQRHQFYLRTQVTAKGLQLLMDGIQTKLIVIQEQQLARLLLHDLTRQLAANAATRAADQHDLTGQIMGQQIGARRHRLTAQEVFNVELTKVLHRDLAAGQVSHAGQRTHMYRQSLQRLDDFVASFARGRRHGQENVSNLAAWHQSQHVFRRKNGQSIDASTHFGVIVIDETDELKLAGHLQCGGSLNSCSASAINQ